MVRLVVVMAVVSKINQQPLPAKTYKVEPSVLELSGR